MSASRIETRVYVDAALIADSIAHLYAIGKGNTPVPVVRRGETKVSADPVGSGELVEWELISGIECLLEINRAAE